MVNSVKSKVNILTSISLINSIHSLLYMEATSNCAAKIKDQIAEINLQIKQILSDPVLEQWSAIDLEKTKDILESFGLNRGRIAEMQHKLKSE